MILEVGNKIQSIERWGPKSLPDKVKFVFINNFLSIEIGPYPFSNIQIFISDNMSYVIELSSGVSEEDFLNGLIRSKVRDEKLNDILN